MPLKIAYAQINPTIGDLKNNVEKILIAIAEGKKNKVDLLLFPELCLSGYPPQDLLLLPHFIEAVEKELESIIEATDDIAIVLGLPRQTLQPTGKKLFNSAAIIENQKLLGFQDKTLLPTYDVFDERRYFEPASKIETWEIAGKKVGITICEDIWSDSLKDYHQNPLEELKSQGIDLLVNLSASPFSCGKILSRLTIAESVVKKMACSFVYCNQVGGNDSLIFDGRSFIFNEKAELIHMGKGFSEDFCMVDLDKKHSLLKPTFDKNEELYSALVLGIKDYFQKSGFKKALLGLSGGIDSAVVACLAKEALGKENVLGVAMPSRYSSQGSIDDAKLLATHLGIILKEISIEKPFQSYLDLLEPEFESLASDVTEENLQARVRGSILMALSNKLGYIVLSTGNKSEMAMGYCTLYGDMCGGLSVISDVTKRQVYELANYINREKEIIPKNTIEKAPSAELRPNQTDQDTLPPYDMIDNVVKCYLEQHMSPEIIAKKYAYDLVIVEDLIKKIHRNEYKRRQAAPGLRVSEKAFSTGRAFPIVERWV